MPCAVADRGDAVTVSQGAGKRRGDGVRRILTASVNELSPAVQETVIHLASTHVHVTDELSVVNGVVQLAESPVNIGQASPALQWRRDGRQFRHAHKFEPLRNFASRNTQLGVENLSSIFGQFGGKV